MQPLFTLFAQHESGGGWINIVDTVARTKLSVIVIVCVVCTVIRLVLSPKILGTAAHLRDLGGVKALKFLNELLDAIIYAAIFVFMIIRPFAVQTFVIPTGSMVPTLLINDVIIANKWVYRTSEPQRGDVVIFNPPPLALKQANMTSETNYIKRLVGVPGDLIEMDKNRLKVNGQFVKDSGEHYFRTFDGASFTPLDKKDLRPDEVMDFKLIEKDGQVLSVQRIEGYGLRVMGEEITDPIQVNEIWSKPAVKIPEGKYLFVGDDRNNSGDGRFWGLVERKEIVGKAVLIMLPFGRMGRVDDHAKIPLQP